MPVKIETELQIYKTSAKKIINEYCNEIILDKYPYYKQINLNRTPEGDEMNLWIDSIRSISNVYTYDIEKCEEVVDVYNLVEEFKQIIKEKICQ